MKLKCCKCQELLDRDLFNNNKNTKSGKGAMCRRCLKEMHKTNALLRKTIVASLADEKWQVINGCHNYSISNFGRVKRNEHYYKAKNNRNVFLHERLLLPNSNNGYLYVSILYSNKYKYPSIHRLVAEHFIPNTENKPQVNHIDFDRTNNKVENLEWVTPRENVLHNKKHNRHGYKSKSVINIKNKNIFRSIKEIRLIENWTYRQAIKELSTGIKYKYA